MCLLRNMYQLLIALNIIFQSATSLPPDDQSMATISALKLGNRCAKLPSMEVSFQTLVEYKCYVDKTEDLSKFIVRNPEDGSSNAFLLTRPRRFGKSVLVDTMFEFFNGNQKLFNNTFIGKNHPDPWTKYPIIRLDFSQELSVDSEEDFEAGLMYKLRKIADSYQINLNAPSAVSGIGDLIEKLNKTKKSPVVVLIDEYDSPYCRAYAQDKTVALTILSTLQSFFSTLKGNENIHFTFLTGITELAIADFFYGFDCVTDITMDSNYPAIVGFTEEELRDYFGDFIKNVATIRKKEAIDILEVMRKFHDGFQFSPVHVRVYSPSSVISYLNSNGTKTNGWSETGGSGSFLNEKFKECKEIAYHYLLLYHINDTSLGGITATESSLREKDDYTSHDEESFTALLFHSGFLSIESCKDGYCYLRFSNMELLHDYIEKISYAIHTDNGHDEWVVGLQKMKTNLIRGKWEDFITGLRSHFAQLPFYLRLRVTHYNESWDQLNLCLALHIANLRNITMEDASNKGRADIALTHRNTAYIFELKYDENNGNALKECRDKYLMKYISLLQRAVVCIGLQFSTQGDISKWGIAIFSNKAKLLQEHGPKEEDKRYRLRDVSTIHSTTSKSTIRSTAPSKPAAIRSRTSKPAAIRSRTSKPATIHSTSSTKSAICSTTSTKSKIRAAPSSTICPTASTEQQYAQQPQGQFAQHQQASVRAQNQQKPFSKFQATSKRRKRNFKATFRTTSERFTKISSTEE